MAQTQPTIDQERITELRAVCSKLDPSARKTWLLEVYDRRQGEDVLVNVLDIKTGKPWRHPYWKYKHKEIAQ